MARPETIPSSHAPRPLRPARAALAALALGLVPVVATTVPARADDHYPSDADLGDHTAHDLHAEGPTVRAAAAEVHPIAFPIEGRNYTYTSSFGAPRTGHTHQGNDLMAPKLTKILSSGTGQVVHVFGTSGTTSGNGLIVRHDDGWETWYLHVNNDSPGTDDGANPPAWRYAPGIAKGSRVTAGQFIAYVGDSGNAEATAPHLHFELHRPDGTAIDPYPSLKAAEAARDNPPPPPCAAPAGFTPATASQGALYAKRAQQWFYRRGYSSGGGEACIVFGNPDDVGVLGDWDGDGRATPGVYRPSTGQWFLSDHALMATVRGPFVIPGWAAGDQPSTYVDGAGGHGIALRRPSNGTWRALADPTASTATQVAAWGDPGDRALGLSKGAGADVAPVVWRAARATAFTGSCQAGSSTAVPQPCSLTGVLTVGNPGDGAATTTGPLVLRRSATGQVFGFTGRAAGTPRPCAAVQYGAPDDHILLAPPTTSVDDCAAPAT